LLYLRTRLESQHDTVSIWIVASVVKSDLIIYLVHPTGINKSRTILTCDRYIAPFGPYQLNSVPVDVEPAAGDDLPQGTDIAFPPIRKREETDGDGSAR
jgi:hypothetical protein